MKKLGFIFLLLSVFILSLTSCDQSVDIYSNGKTDYTIVTAEAASEEVINLAKEIKALSGANPELTFDSVPPTSREIIIGDTSREETAFFAEKLKSVSTISAFHYIVAEKDGKLVILSETDVGYIYALDYIKATYIKEGKFSVPKDTCDIKWVIWDDYYASDLYFDRLTAEADKDRYDNQKEQIKNEMDRYEENKGNTIMTVEQVIEQYKKQAASFNNADFGEYSASVFTSANKYRKPTVYPGNSHTRLLFTENSIGKVRENLDDEQNTAAYKRYITLSDVPCDGKFKSLTGNMAHNYDASTTAKIEAKAFRYAMTGEEIYGYEAIIAAKNAMLTINVPHTVSDWCRTYGHLMYVVACVYDWCYDLLTEQDKLQLLRGGVNLLGMHLEIVCYVGPTNKVPIEQGTMYGHGAESQLLVDYLSFAIAVYDEAPEIYELVAGRILNDYVEGQDYLFQSGSHWEGSMYGAFRSSATIISNTLVNKMTDGKFTPFTEKFEDAAIDMTYQVRPDGQVYRIGDINENKKEYSYGSHASVWFYSANLYGNSYLKSFAYEYLDGFTYFTDSVGGLSAVQFLALNDPSVSHICNDKVPLTYTATYPNTHIFARSANNDQNAFSIYMVMPETYSSSHAHMECGSFQIFYKGALASDSGAYTGWGGTHHMGYNMQTISSNSLLIYNPDFVNQKISGRENMIYSGGQSISNGADLPTTLDKLLQHPALGQVKSLGVANVEKDGKYLYSYMGGDMTGAYDEETASEVCRYMFAVATGDASHPLAFVTFDRITSDDASFRKSALIHVQNEPTIIGNYSTMTDATGGKLVEKSDPEASDNYAIITNNGGKLVVQSVGDETEFTVIGGSGYEFWIPGVDENGNYSLEDGKNLPTNIKLVDGSIAEYGWGRIEISPAVADKTNHMLTVMYVTDEDNKSSPVKAEDISSQNLAGTVIFGKAILFPKNEKMLTAESSFTLSAGAECFINGVEKGSWNIMKDNTVIDTVEAADGTNMITFTAESAGVYTVKPAN